jgi:amino-acid N-acetyltransferase
MPRLRIRRAASTDLSRLKEFLTACSLPTVGLEDWCPNFFIASGEEGSWVGIAGYELYGEVALLRSIAVDKRSRGMGHGQVLVEAVLADARKRGARRMYLLTETAMAYFKRLGFDALDRVQVEKAVKKSVEFTECCSGAQAMRRAL